MKKNLLLFLLFFPFVAKSATTWIGPSTITAADWNTASNWSPSGKPAGSEQITFNTPVTIADNVPLTANNTLVIQNTFTINSGVTLTNGDVSISGGAIINNGVFNAHNVTYTNSGGSITNNDSMNIVNLNVGNSTHAGMFTNNSILSITKDIVVEEGVFNNTSSGTTGVNGITVQNGGTILNGGYMNSSDTTSSDQISINAGGTFTNQASGFLNVDLSTSNVYAINSQGAFSNTGAINVGDSPYNPGSKGILVGSGSSFSNTGALAFAIDPANCVITNNSGSSGSFATAPITIISGKNCLSTILPVTLVSFTVHAASGFNSISWIAGNEMNLAKYELQKTNSDSTSAQWITISSFMPQATHIYQFNDQTKQASSFYRLKIIDVNGNYTYSVIIKINNDKANNSLLIYPTPATQTIHITGLPLGRNFAVAIINASGVTVKHFAYSNNSLNQELQYNITDIPTGVYELVLKNNQGTILERGKFVKID